MRLRAEGTVIGASSCDKAVVSPVWEFLYAPTGYRTSVAASATTRCSAR